LHATVVLVVELLLVELTEVLLVELDEVLLESVELVVEAASPGGAEWQWFWSP